MITKKELLEKHESKLEEKRSESKINFVKEMFNRIDRQLSSLYTFDVYDFSSNPYKDIRLPGYGENDLFRKHLPFLQEEIDVILSELKRAGYEAEIKFHKVYTKEEGASPDDSPYLRISLR